jgi:hypothetical protein
MKTSECWMESRGGHDGWRIARRWLLQRRATWNGKLYHKEFFLRCETKLIILCLSAALTTGAQSRTQHLPVTDPEKMADALEQAMGACTAASPDTSPRSAAHETLVQLRIAAKRAALAVTGTSLSIRLSMPALARRW